ncbi:uncharacterized protein [Ptychodera flava]|uniref:uncharacterized protein n=1 Tax=Ptychodera flava TaxID=63121 RepID=UPI003969CF94
MEFRQLLAQSREKLSSAYRDGNFDIIRELYLPDVVLMAPGQETKQGIEEILKAGKEMLDDGITEVQYQSDETIGPVGSEFIVDRGRFTFRTNDGTATDRGKYLMVWRLTEGEYRVYIDSFSSDTPDQ